MTEGELVQHGWHVSVVDLTRRSLLSIKTAGVSVIAALASARAFRFNVRRKELARTLRPLLRRLLNESLLLTRLIAAC